MILCQFKIHLLMSTIKQHIAALTFYTVKILAFLIVYLIVYFAIITFIDSPNKIIKIYITSLKFPVSIAISFALVFNKYANKRIWDKLATKLEDVFA